MCGNLDTEDVRHDYHPGRYLCAQCWTVFAGSPDEWAYHRTDREQFAIRRENVRKRMQAQEADA